VGGYSISGATHGFLTSIAPLFASQPILADDDRADCPGAVSTIQEAVRRATPGASILACRSLYTGTVSITGPEKNGLKLIKVTTDKEWGAGNLVYLENAHYNTIEQNQLIDRDRAGVMLLDSANNFVRLNMTYNNKLVGIVTAGGGAGDTVTDNTVVANGRYGIDVQNTSQVRVEGNRARSNSGDGPELGRQGRKQAESRCLRDVRPGGGLREIAGAGPDAALTRISHRRAVLSRQSRKFGPG
jgi:parallel beta-helix repeat protein